MITGGKRVLLKLCHFRFAARWYSGTYFDSSTDCPRHDIAAARAEDRAVRHGLQGGCPTESIALSRRGSSSHGSGERLNFGARVGEASGHPKARSKKETASREPWPQRLAEPRPSWGARLQAGATWAVFYRPKGSTGVAVDPVSVRAGCRGGARAGAPKENR